MARRTKAVNPANSEDSVNGGPLTISALARQFHLARSTLLHYDRLGLLQPTGKTGAGYRLYGPDAAARLGRIVELRAAGMSLDSIGRVLDSKVPLTDALTAQLQSLHRQQADTADQLRIVRGLLGGTSARAKPARGKTAATAFTKASWTAMFRAIGLSDADMKKWHRHFELAQPGDHQAFLESLGLDAAEVRRIRSWSLR